MVGRLADRNSRLVTFLLNGLSGRTEASVDGFGLRMLVSQQIGRIHEVFSPKPVSSLYSQGYVVKYQNYCKGF